MLFKRFKKAIKHFVVCAVIAGTMIGSMPVTSYAAEAFDPVFYAALYPDVVAAYGYNPELLYNHYVKYGQKEKRLPSATSKPGAKVNAPMSAPQLQTAQASAVQQPSTGIVALKNIPNLAKLKKKCTDAEMQQAYNAAFNVVSPLVGKTQAEQLDAVMSKLRAIFDAGGSYSMTTNHYNDPYGYFILGTASCAGSTRATILCLKMLGFSSVEHVHENQYCHQWARVRMSDGSYWICDPFGLYSGPEPAPYVHPYAQ